MKIPFLGRRTPPAELEPIRFEPVRRVFKAQVEIRMRNDLSGWVGDKANRKRWALAAGQEYAIDEERAREFVAKGYARFVHEPRKPISPDERAAAEASVTRIGMP